MTFPYRFRLRRGTAAQWTQVNPILADGEEGYEKDTGKRKVGDGVTRWNALPYNSGGTSSGIDTAAVNALIQSALELYATDADVTGAIQAALEPLREDEVTLAQVQGIVDAAIAGVPTYTPTRSALEPILYDKQYGWELQPGSDVMATSIDGLGPVAITDENAGGVIGDIAYVVSGYAYNSGDNGLVDTGLGGTLNGPIPTTIDKVMSTATPELYTAADAGIIMSLAHPETPGRMNDYFRSFYANASFEVFSNGGYSNSGWERLAFLDGYDYAWTFIERYNLATKTWLPRIPMPHTFVDVPFNVRGAGTYQRTAGPYSMEAGTLQPPSEAGNSRLITEPWTGRQIAGVSAGDVPAAFPAGVYDVVSLSNDVNSPSTDDPEAWGAALGTAITAPYSFDLGPYAAEGGLAGVIGNKLYFGGGDGRRINGNEFFVFDPATEEFTRLADAPADNYPDYKPFGVIDGKLWYFAFSHAAYSYDPAGLNAWVRHATTGTDLASTISDQLQGIEIGGKLYFVYANNAYVFDPEALTAAQGALVPNGEYVHANEAVYPHNGKIRFHPQLEVTVLEYDPIENSWTEIDESTSSPPSNSYSTIVMYNDAPYVLSGLRDRVAGVFGLTDVSYKNSPAAVLSAVNRVADLATPHSCALWFTDLPNDQPGHATGISVMIPGGSGSMTAQLAANTWVDLDVGAPSTFMRMIVRKMPIPMDSTDYFYAQASPPDPISANTFLSKVAGLTHAGSANDVNIAWDALAGRFKVLTEGLYYFEIRVDFVPKA